MTDDTRNLIRLIRAANPEDKEACAEVLRELQRRGVLTPEACATSSLLAAKDVLMDAADENGVEVCELRLNLSLHEVTRQLLASVQWRVRDAAGRSTLPHVNTLTEATDLKVMAGAVARAIKDRRSRWQRTIQLAPGQLLIAREERYDQTPEQRAAQLADFTPDVAPDERAADGDDDSWQDFNFRG